MLDETLPLESREGAARDLGGMGPAGLGGLVRLAGTVDDEVLALLKVAFEVGDAGGELARRAADPEREVGERVACVCALRLVKLGEVARGVLRGLVSEGPERLAREAAMVLAVRPQPEDEAALVGAVGAESADVRWFAAVGLAGLARAGSRGARQALEERQRVETDELVGVEIGRGLAGARQGR